MKSTKLNKKKIIMEKKVNLFKVLREPLKDNNVINQCNNNNNIFMITNNNLNKHYLFKSYNLNTAERLENIQLNIK